MRALFGFVALFWPCAPFDFLRLVLCCQSVSFWPFGFWVSGFGFGFGSWLRAPFGFGAFMVLRSFSIFTFTFLALCGIVAWRPGTERLSNVKDF